MSTVAIFENYSNAAKITNHLYITCTVCEFETAEDLGSIIFPCIVSGSETKETVGSFGILVPAFTDRVFHSGSDRIWPYSYKVKVFLSICYLLKHISYL